MTAKIAMAPMMATVIFVFIGCTLWTMFYSLTTSRVLPASDPLGKDLLASSNTCGSSAMAVENLGPQPRGLRGSDLVFVFVVGFILAVFMDQKIRFENAFRTIFLYPFALSFVITGLVWQWMLNPASACRNRSATWVGEPSFDWIANRKMVVYTLVIAGVWQMTGLVMALMLAACAASTRNSGRPRVDGILKWRTYVQIVIPMMRPVS